MPQSSRVIVTRCASARQRASSGGEAAVRRKRSGRKAAGLRIRQCLLRLAPTRKPLRAGAVEQLVDVADAEMVPALIVVELVPRDRRGHGRPFATTRRV